MIQKVELSKATKKKLQLIQNYNKYYYEKNSPIITDQRL